MLHVLNFQTGLCGSLEYMGDYYEYQVGVSKGGEIFGWNLSEYREITNYLPRRIIDF